MTLLASIPSITAAQGSVHAWGSNGWGQVGGAPAGAQFTQVAGTGLHTLALHTDGSITS